MNLKGYLENKKKLQYALGEEHKSYRKKCLKCLRPENICFCSSIESFNTKTKIIILMHPKEARRNAIGTGRLANISLDNSQIIVGVNFDQDKFVQSLLSSTNYFPVILYPGENSFKVNDKGFKEHLPPDKELLVFVIDGTWPCAKTMMRESKTLQTIPKVSFDNSMPSQFKIKQQPDKLCLSTIESIYLLLDGLEKSGYENLGKSHNTLLQHLEKIVTYQIDCANNPNQAGYRRGQFKSPEERTTSKRWRKRKIFFEKKNYSE